MLSCQVMCFLFVISMSEMKLGLYSLLTSCTSKKKKKKRGRRKQLMAHSWIRHSLVVRLFIDQLMKGVETGQLMTAWVESVRSIDGEQFQTHLWMTGRSGSLLKVHTKQFPQAARKFFLHTIYSLPVSFLCLVLRARGWFVCWRTQLELRLFC